MQRGVIYIVDDSEDYRFIIKQIFDKFLTDFPVRFFDSGDALVELLINPDQSKKSNFPALIILDLNMPKLSGHSTLTQLKDPANMDHQYLKQIPVLVMSGVEEANEIAACYKAGANAFLKKPIEFDKLKELFSSVAEFWLDVNQGPEIKSLPIPQQKPGGPIKPSTL
ncbi:response regulator [Dyadobacter psychrotolerans]|nr:response regulator [Dyadobacter psychrotolerans]